MNKIITMTLKKSTKGTHVYEADDDSAAVKTIYVKRDALPGKPLTIKVSIEAQP